MPHPRFTIARLLALILFFGIIFAGLRSGSDDWFKLIYSLTFLTLVYAAIAVRYRGAFWHGFAVAGWAYFVTGFGPWIGSSPELTQPLRGANRNLITSILLEVATDLISVRSGSGAFPTMLVDGNQANRDGIGHCALTILFGLAGGLVSRALAGRPTTE